MPRFVSAVRIKNFVLMQINVLVYIGKLASLGNRNINLLMKKYIINKTYSLKPKTGFSLMLLAVRM